MFEEFTEIRQRNCFLWCLYRILTLDLIGGVKFNDHNNKPTQQAKQPEKSVSRLVLVEQVLSGGKWSPRTHARRRHACRATAVHSPLLVGKLRDLLGDRETGP